MLELLMKPMPPLLLASNSPRRKDLLSLSGLPFVVFPVQVDETPLQKENPEACVTRLSELKLRAALEQADRMGISSEQIVLTADTIVTFQGEILGKPKNSADAADMLQRLRNREHRVITAIHLATVDSSAVESDLCNSPVKMRDYSDEEIMTYIQSGDPFDKAGAYAIQSPTFRPVEHFSDCFASVMGLPLCHLTRSLNKLGIKTYEDIPVVCQDTLQYNCPVYAAILGDSGSK